MNPTSLKLRGASPFNHHKYWLSIFIIYSIGLIVFALSTVAAFAQSTTAPPTNPDAAQIRNCSQAGQVPVSVGTTQASGTYVPVADQAVITNSSMTVFNTGMLVYKECTLREIVNAQRIAATSILVANGTSAFMTSRNGGPLSVQKRGPERVYLASDPQILLNLSNSTFNTIPQLYQNAVKQAVGQGYYAATRNPSAEFTCPYQGLDTAFTGHPQGSTMDAILAIGTLACNPVLSSEAAKERAMQYSLAVVDDLDTAVSEGQGIYPRLRPDANGNYIFTTDAEITTPASFVRDIELQLLTSGFRQQEAANNVNEMVGTLFSNVGTQILSNNQGINSLLQPTANGGASFLSQVVSQSGGQLTQITGNGVLQVLSAALTLERTYNQTVSAIATNLTQTITQLRAVEKQCWASLAQNVCTSGSISADGKSCTAVSGNNLTNIATSTAFSQAVVDNNIISLASTTLVSLNKSNTAITALNQFIAAVIANPGNQAAVLAQFKQLAAQGAFHSQSDVSTAQSQLQTVTTATGNLVSNTINTWAGTDSQGASTIPWDNSIDPGEGWCNYQNQPTLNAWDLKWR